VAMAGTPDGRGYWLAAMDGGVFAFGDAGFFGSMGATHLVQPVVGMATTRDGGGYWLVAADGGIFAFGDAHYYGSEGGQNLPAGVVGMATPNGLGYWLVGGDGSLYPFGDAPNFGSLADVNLDSSVAGIAPGFEGKGYWLVETDGEVFGFGDAGYYGEMPIGGSPAPIAGLVPTADDKGYWLFDPDGWNYTFANPAPDGYFPGSQAIVAASESQVQPDPDTGYFCNPYGPCEEWCALFATWAWEQGGWPIPSYPFTGSIYDWAAQNGLLLPPGALPVPGDAVLFGTGPWSIATSVHVGIVAQVWPDGALVTIEGDAGPAQTGSLAVVINGPFLATDSAVYNGFPIYAFAQP
jgi:hypothetical protein